MNYQEAADFLNLNIGTLYSLVHKKKIPHIRMGNRIVRFSKEALDKWIAENTVENSQKKGEKNV